MIMGDILKLVVVVVVMFVVNWKLALLSMIPIPLLLWSTNIFKNSIQKSFQDVRTQVARLNAFVQEHIQGMSIVQLFGREQQEFKKFQAINREHRKAHIRSVLAYSIFFPVVEILSAISLGFLVWWGVRDVLAGVATLGDVFAYILFINMLFRPDPPTGRPLQCAADGHGGQRARLQGAGHRSDHRRTRAPAAPPSCAAISASKGLWFAYEDDDFVLKDISFEAKAGQMMALVGATGSGKSSMVNVLSRAYEFQKGAVFVDGHDIRDYRRWPTCGAASAWSCRTSSSSATPFTTTSR